MIFYSYYFNNIIILFQRIKEKRKNNAIEIL